MLSKKVFLKEMKIFCLMYNQDLDPIVIQRYYEILCIYSDKEFIAACKEVARTHIYKSMPTIADIVKRIDGDSITDAERAWAQIISKPITGDIKDKRAVELYVILGIYNMKDKEIFMLRKTFIDAYNEIERFKKDNNKTITHSTEIKELTKSIGELC